MDYREKTQKYFLRSSQKKSNMAKKTSIDRTCIEFEMENQF
jgi:hypothetical protein